MRSFLKFAGCLYRQARFAHAARSRQCYQPMREQTRFDLAQQVIPSDQGSQRDRACSIEAKGSASKEDGEE